MNDFIKKQQELAQQRLGKVLLVNGKTELETIIQQIIQNTGEEMLRLAEGEKVNDPILDDKNHIATSINEVAKIAKAVGNNQAIDTLKQHIANVTGAK